MINYRPTWLYIKKHNITGLKYFGKTVKTDPTKYNGSGKYWILHLKEHGYNVSTIWCQLFIEQADLERYALAFSAENNISESKDWANLKPENGLDGGCVGTHRSASTRQKLSEANKGRKQSDETKLKRSRSNKGKHGIPKSEETRQKIKTARKLQVMKPHSQETKQKIGAANKGRKLSEEMKQKMRKSIIILGNNYSSVKCASISLGISEGVIYKNLISLKYPEWNYI